jgi:hypothetical protein
MEVPLPEQQPDANANAIAFVFFGGTSLSRPKINGTTDKVVRVLERLRLELAAVAAWLCRGAACAPYPTRKHGDAAPWLQQNIGATRPARPSNV